MSFPTPSSILCLSLATASVLLAAPTETAPPAAATDGPFHRGVVVSCPRWGPVWGSPAMAESLAELKALGVDWVALHPYGWVRANGEVEFRPAAELAFLSRAVELSEAAGVELFWKPHLGYWGSFSWRGAIEFADDAAWRRFFDGYRAFIVDQARFAEQAGVELLAVGVELEKTVPFEAEWRRILAEVRRVYRGRLTYAANWDGVERVPFWDAVDLIGVHAYFPLAGDETPDRETLGAAWERHMAGLRELSARHAGKRILFAEIGYSRSPSAAREPWKPENDDRAQVHALRRLLFETALERIEREPAIAGMFWWKWIPGADRFDRDFSMKDPEARAALARHWAPPQTPAAVTTPQ